MLSDHSGGAFQISVIAGCHLLWEKDDLVVGKILHHAKPDLLTQRMPAEISDALHQDGAALDLRRHGVAVISLCRTFIDDRNTQIGQKPLLAEPNRVLPAIRRVREIQESRAAIA